MHTTRIQQLLRVDTAAHTLQYLAHHPPTICNNINSTSTRSTARCKLCFLQASQRLQCPTSLAPAAAHKLVDACNGQHH
jgi:hypothetical protein